MFLEAFFLQAQFLYHLPQQVLNAAMHPHDADHFYFLRGGQLFQVNLATGSQTFLTQIIGSDTKNYGFIIEKNTMSEDTISQYKKYYL